MLAIGSDHGGYELKQAIIELLQEREIAYRDMGTSGDESVDYPDFADKVARAVAAGEARAGILICGTGIGMSISANKRSGIRAALVHDSYTARMAREHNDANILVLGGRVLSSDLAKQIVAVWLDSDYEGGRHQRRLDKIAALEND